MAATFTGGPSSGLVGFSTAIYDRNGRQIRSDNKVSIEVENQQSARLDLVVPVDGMDSRVDPGGTACRTSSRAWSVLKPGSPPG